MIKLLHFADAHIDMVNYGRHDPLSGLPYRVLDFLKSLDEIVDTAIREKVDLVVFAGDAYKDRTPAPTYQREWGRRIMRLSQAGIRTLLLVGNHDYTPSFGRAHALEAFDTLAVPHVTVVQQPVFLSPVELEDLPLQVIAIPWISQPALLASLNLTRQDPEAVKDAFAAYIAGLVNGRLEKLDPELPCLMAAHATVQGARYSSERAYIMGSELVFPKSLLLDPRLDYVALGHIHLHQDLNPGGQPPIIYPGSIERINFGEAHEEKYFVIANLERGHCEIDWRPLINIRPFIERSVRLESPENVTELLVSSLPTSDQLENAIVRLIVEYPRHLEASIDEATIRQQVEQAFDFQLIRRPQLDARTRLDPEEAIASLSPLELLDRFWLAVHAEETDREGLKKLAEEIIQASDNPDLE